MGQFDKFDGKDTQHKDTRPVACQVCEAMLPDAVDGMLSDPEQRAFEKHVAGCTVCAQELEEAQRGAAWLGMLKGHAPEPSDALLARILAQTTGLQGTGERTAAAVFAEAPALAPAFVPPVVAKAPVWTATPLHRQQKAGWAVSAWASVRATLSLDLSLDWMKPLLQPRMAMTAAMAFFSIALTLNLTGVRLNELNASSFKPSSLRRAVADRGASAVRSFQNMRVVYQAEAQVNDLRSNWQQDVQDRGGQDRGGQDRGSDARPAPQTQPQQDAPKPKQETPQGSSRLDFEPVNPQGAGMTRKGA